MKKTAIDYAIDCFGHELHVGDPILYPFQYSKCSPTVLKRTTVGEIYLMQKREYVRGYDNGIPHYNSIQAKYVALDYEKLYEMQRLPKLRQVIIQ